MKQQKPFLNNKNKSLRHALIFFLSVLIVIVASPQKTIAHINDLSLAKMEIQAQNAQVTFTLPKDFISFVDEDEDGEITVKEVKEYQKELETLLRDRVRLANENDQVGKLTVKPSSTLIVPPSSQITTETHTTLILDYSWRNPLETINIKYDFFPTNIGMGIPTLSTAHCLATIYWEDQIKTHVFGITNKQLSLGINATNSSFNLPFIQETQSRLMTLFFALIWGGFHALSPGHGKTMISAYLVGTKASFKQAVALGLTTTITHTIGVFFLGGMALLASAYVLPEQISPWLSLVSGIILVAIGVSLIRKRLKKIKTHHHHHHHHHHQVSLASWRDIFALGISGGLVPCPAALVLLLSAIALQKITYGLLLVLTFSVGLAIALILLGLLFIYGKEQFQKLPQGQKGLQKLSILGAIAMMLVGLGITGHAVATLL